MNCQSSVCDTHSSQCVGSVRRRGWVSGVKGFQGTCHGYEPQEMALIPGESLATGPSGWETPWHKGSWGPEHLGNRHVARRTPPPPSSTSVASTDIIILIIFIIHCHEPITVYSDNHRQHVFYSLKHLLIDRTFSLPLTLKTLHS